MVGLGYSTKDSISITYVFLMGGAFASMWKAKGKKNPKTDGPLIDYNLVLLTLPSAVSGSLFGVLFHLSKDNPQSFHFLTVYDHHVLHFAQLPCLRFILKTKGNQENGET